jgi:histidinol-phosphatase
MARSRSSQTDAALPLARLLELAIEAARTPSAKILSGFRNPALPVEIKADGSPVTPFDREAEQLIRGVLQSDPQYRFPVLGEEFGADREDARYRWVVDPIDGTLPYTRGLPYFGTLVALEDVVSARSLVGVIQLPAHGELYSAARGLGAHCNGEPIHVAPARELRNCLVSAPDVAKFALAGLASGYERLSAAGPYFRGIGDCWMHAMTARGAVDVAIEFPLNRWDVAATEVIVEEAGGLCLTRRSQMNPAKYDMVCGSETAVAEVARLLGFTAGSAAGT